MRLDSFKYIRNRGEPNEWRIDGCQLGDVNLIVGKNASGKSNILKAIYIISELLLEGIKQNPLPKNQEWQLLFDQNSERPTEYLVKLNNEKIVEERLTIDEKTPLERNESGEGKIFAEELQQDIRFQTPSTELAAVKRRDTIQHPFLEDIYQWANALRFYEFGTKLGRDTIIPQIVDLKKNNVVFKNDQSVIPIFLLGKQEFGDQFTTLIVEDMKKIDYDISTIETKTPSFGSDFSSIDALGGLGQYLYVKEKKLNAYTEQFEMSQGMFRVLSLFIQIDYYLLAEKPSCILIDDIGEGLDYQRSSAIIKVLIEKAKTGLVQLIMTTNDENIMNGVPLEYWSVIERQPGVAKLHNYSNSPEQFEQFKYIGLNNFDFFASEFYLQEPEKEEAID
jgi:AAA15 family ATPase/GTPase